MTSIYSVQSKGIVLELVRMLSGETDGAFFQFNENLKLYTYKSSTIPMNSQIREFFKTADLLAKITEFACKKEQGEGIVTRTFKSCLETEIGKLNQDLLIYTEERMGNSRNHSILKLKYFIKRKNFKRRIDCMCFMIKEITKMKDLPNRKKVSQFLSFLYTYLNSHFSLRNEDCFNIEIDLVFQIFSSCLDVYLRFLDNWCFQGLINDTFGEFFIKEDEENASNNKTEKYWNVHFKLYEDCIPIFLQTIKKEILSSGKSIKVIQEIEKLIFTKRHNFKDLLYFEKTQRLSLNINFSKRFKALITNKKNKKKKKKKKKVDVEDPFSKPTEKKIMKVGETDLDALFDPKKVIEKKNEEDEMKIQKFILAAQIQPLEHSNTDFKEKIGFDPFETQKKEEGENGELEEQSTFLPFHVLMDRSLLQILRDEYHKVSQLLLVKVMEDLNIFKYLFTMRSIFLMEGGDIMDYFTRKIFKGEKKGFLKLTSSQFTFDQSFSEIEMNSTLQEALMYAKENPRTYKFKKKYYDIFETKEILKNLKVSLGQNLTPNPLENDYSQIIFNYNLKWPLNIIINSKIIGKLNQIKSFLIVLKKAKYSLNHIKIPRNYTNKIFHQIHIIIFEFKHFVNTFENYVLIKCIDSRWKSFCKVAQDVTTFDEFLEQHENYVEGIYDFFFHKRSKFVMTTIRKILNLSTNLQEKVKLFISQWKIIEGKGENVVSSLEELKQSEAFEEKMKTEIEAILINFRTNIKSLFMIIRTILSKSRNEELEELFIRLNYNNFY